MKYFFFFLLINNSFSLDSYNFLLLDSYYSLFLEVPLNKEFYKIKGHYKLELLHDLWTKFHSPVDFNFNIQFTGFYKDLCCNFNLSKQIKLFDCFKNACFLEITLCYNFLNLSTLLKLSELSFSSFLSLFTRLIKNFSINLGLIYKTKYFNFKIENKISSLNLKKTLDSFTFIVEKKYFSELIPWHETGHTIMGLKNKELFEKSVATTLVPTLYNTAITIFKKKTKPPSSEQYAEFIKFFLAGMAMQELFFEKNSYNEPLNYSNPKYYLNCGGDIAAIQNILRFVDEKDKYVSDKESIITTMQLYFTLNEIKFLNYLYIEVKEELREYINQNPSRFQNFIDQLMINETLYKDKIEELLGF